MKHTPRLTRPAILAALDFAARVELSPSISDDDVLQQANFRGALLVTADKDFGELVFRQGKVYAGVVLLRLSGLSMRTKADMVVAVLQQRAAELLGAFTVIAPSAVRIRRRDVGE